MGYVREAELVLFRRGTFYSGMQAILNQKRPEGLQQYSAPPIIDEIPACNIYKDYK